jgi:bifunctional ADP-heptose synthase (sugar kinase/adenylyltransferase)
MLKDRSGVVNWLESAVSEQKLLVIGDFMLDRYL